MELVDLVALAGKSGLFRIINKKNRTGVLIESLDDLKTRMIVNQQTRLLFLSETTLYTTSKEDHVPLIEIIKNIKKQFGNVLTVNSQSTGAELMCFMKLVQHDIDEDRVYSSDIKKVLKWYEIIVKYAPELLNV